MRSAPGRIATGIVAAVLVVLLAGAAVLAYQGGQTFLAVIGGIGALLTLWALATARKAA
jgi:hypothetical protein